MTLCTTFLKLYAEVLRHTILLDVFHGSCSVFFPPHLSLDLFQVCSESGYIHSCGRNVYARELAIADDKDFVKAFAAHVEQYHAKEKVFLTVYSHEDFSVNDRDHASYLRGGLDDVKIYAEKYYVGQRSLVSLLQNLQQKYRSKVVLADPDPKEHRHQRKKQEVSCDSTYWLIVDRLAGLTGSCPTERQFLICYEQLFKNENPVHLFDENKPAWVAHTTIPPLLAGAMINITRPSWQSEGEINIYDPFSGTGTTVLEGLKFDRVRFTCNDKSPIAAALLKDNMLFFSFAQEELAETLRYLDLLSSPECREYHKSHSARTDKPSPYLQAMDLYEKLPESSFSEDQWFDVSAEIAKTLNKWGFQIRLRFYLALRTRLRHAGAFKRNTEGWISAYVREAKILRLQTQWLADLRTRTKTNSRNDGLLESSAEYSKGCTLSPAIFDKRALQNGKVRIISKDSTTTTRQKFDVIVTDPPYGFNNEIGSLELAKLLTETLDVLLSDLKDNSQLVMALPDRSHSGRRIPLFATRTWVIHQVIAKAQEHGFEALTPACILPSHGLLFQPPYYWNSEKALKRSVLHFQFRKKRRPLKDRLST